METEIFRQNLLKRCEELSAHSLRSQETRAPVELDQTSQGRLSRQDALMQQAMAEATERQRLQELRRIEAALNRIENGDFGYCAACEEEIAPKRLEHDPSIPTCIECASSAGGV